MDAGLTAAVFGLAGALIGSASSVATIIVQSHYKDKRDRSRQVTDLSLAEHNTHLELLKAGKTDGGVLPISAYAHHNSLMLQALDDGNLTPERIAEIIELNEKFCRAVAEADKKRRKISN
jgi:hypothetical protein